MTGTLWDGPRGVRQASALPRITLLSSLPAGSSLLKVIEFKEAPAAHSDCEIAVDLSCQLAHHGQCLSQMLRHQGGCQKVHLCHNPVVDQHELGQRRARFKTSTSNFACSRSLTLTATSAQILINGVCGRVRTNTTAEPLTTGMSSSSSRFGS